MQSPDEQRTYRGEEYEMGARVWPPKRSKTKCQKTHLGSHSLFSPSAKQPLVNKINILDRGQKLFLSVIPPSILMVPPSNLLLQEVNLTVITTSKLSGNELTGHTIMCGIVERSWGKRRTQLMVPEQWITPSILTLGEANLCISSKDVWTARERAYSSYSQVVKCGMEERGWG